MRPEYACAVITDARGWLLLQLRPAEARHAPGQLTCFGGRCEAGDADDLACLRRELAEELGWQPAQARPCCDLRRGPRFIARFFRCTWPGGVPRTEAGHRAVWTPWSALPGLPVSPWHAAVLVAVRDGVPCVEV